MSHYRLKDYFRSLHEFGMTSPAEAGPASEDGAIALWIRENPEAAIALLLQQIATPLRQQRIAAALAVYHEACANRGDASKALQRLGGMIAGAIFDDLRQAVEKAWSASYNN